jgi:hypothetical protein
MKRSLAEKRGIRLADAMTQECDNETFKQADYLPACSVAALGFRYALRNHRAG